jgi:tRNA pseudouridine38-40 synthase
MWWVRPPTIEQFVLETLLNKPDLHVISIPVGFKPGLDLQQMNRAAAALIGEHDFATFGTAPQGENTRRRVLKSEWTVEPISERVRLVEYKIEATAFLYHMVRTVVGMLVEVGLKRITAAEFVDIFQSKDRSRAYRMAPPHGLTLTEVKY